MALSISLPTGITDKSIGLEVWMERVQERAEKARLQWEVEPVHDLRVALRRCRTMADGLKEVNPDPRWRKLKRTTRRLFQALGALRDTQVMRAWARRLAPVGDPARRHMLRILAQQEKERKAEAERALERFDWKVWRRWTRKLPGLAQLFPVESIVFQRLALLRLNEAFELYQRARKGRSRIAWHRLRIGLKRFRYTVENFLPQRHQAWGEELKRLQDLLGEVHDLDVLYTELRRREAELGGESLAPWLDRIDKERMARLAEFRSGISQGESLWSVWRAGFNEATSLKAVTPPRARQAYSAS